MLEQSLTLNIFPWMYLKNYSCKPNKKAWKVPFPAISAVSLAQFFAYASRQPMVALRLDSGGSRQVISQPRGRRIKKFE